MPVRGQRQEDLPRTVINPWEFNVYGWERKKDPRVVWALVQAIRRGTRIPPVFAQPRDDGGYNLDSNWTDPSKGFMVIDGGHNRALAHIIEETPMEIRVTGGTQRHSRRRMPIVDVVLKKQQGEFKDYRHRHPWADFSPPDLDFMNGRLAAVKSQLLVVETSLE